MKEKHQKKLLHENLLKMIQGFEFLGASFPAFGKVYHRVFYQKLVEKEIKIAGIQPGMRVIQVGCGPYPFSAIMLAKQGCKVEAIDNDPQALERAGYVLEKLGLKEKVDLKLIDGHRVDYGEFDRVFVSLHVEPKDSVLQKAIAEMGARGKVVFRNPRGFLKLFYSGVQPQKLPVPIFSRIKEKLGKESLCISSCKVKNLTEAGFGEELIIKSVPPHPLLPALGLRPGKMVCLKGRQYFNGPFLALVDGRKVALGFDLAQMIEVQGGE